MKKDLNGQGQFLKLTAPISMLYSKGNRFILFKVKINLHKLKECAKQFEEIKANDKN